MAARSNSGEPFAWTEKDFHDGASPVRQQLAVALRRLCRHLAIKSSDGGTVFTRPTQAQAAKYLHVSESSLTRYLTGQYVPPEKAAALIFDTACRDAGVSKALASPGSSCSNCERWRSRSGALTVLATEMTHVPQGGN
ncbi:helix-turn-helix domain-containing protein [Streptomyces thermocarboxydus]